jgi:hypothetical protein
VRGEFLHNWAADNGTVAQVLPGAGSTPANAPAVAEYSDIEMAWRAA